MSTDITASGVLNYTIPLTSARALSGNEAASTSIGSLSTYTNNIHPNTEKFIEGFHWDNRTWSTEETDNFGLILKSNWDPTVSGLNRDYFQSGIGSDHDLELLDILDIPSSGVNNINIFNTWMPEINHGYYYDYSDEYYLFSDDSEILYATYSGNVTGLEFNIQSGFTYLDLSSYPKVGIPIHANSYQWDANEGQYLIDRSVTKKATFTGIRDEDFSRLSTYNSDTKSILYHNVDRSFDEFVVVESGNSPQLVFNHNYSEEVGSLTDAPNNMEEVGISTGGINQRFHLIYSPVDQVKDVTIYSYLTSSGPLTQWETIPIDEEIASGTYQVKLDHDLGILEFGDNIANSGVNIPSVGHTIAAHYFKTLKIEYEPENTSDTVLGVETSVNPIYRKSGRGYVHLKTAQSNPASIVLTAELNQLVSETLFGPLSIGNNFAGIIATVYDPQGNVIEDQPVTFEITSSPAIGTFGTLDSTTNSITDYKGEAKAFYNPPRVVSDIGHNVTASGFSNLSDPIASGDLPNESPYTGVTEAIKLNIDNTYIEGSTDDIFLYEVHIDDLVQGYRDLNVSENLEAQIEEYYRNWFVDEGIYGPTGVTSGNNLYTIGSLTSADWEFNHRLVWDLMRPNIFDESIIEGRKKIVAKLDELALDPHTFQSGMAISPVHPIRVNDLGAGEYDLIYNTTSHSIEYPTASDTVPSGTLYSYFVVAPTSVKIQASTFNNRLKQYIYSNEIEIKLSIPGHMNGEWIIDSINENHITEISSLLEDITANNQTVPLGFRLRSSNVTLAAALDGVTFLDKNPKYNRNIYEEATVSGVRVGYKFTVED